MIICVCVFTFACLSAFSPHVLCACSHSQICLGFRPRASQLSVLTYTHSLCLLLCACNSAVFGSSDRPSACFSVPQWWSLRRCRRRSSRTGGMYTNRIHISQIASTFHICDMYAHVSLHISHFTPTFRTRILHPHFTSTCTTFPRP